MSEQGLSSLLYHYQSSVKVGELERYVITYNLYDGDDLPPNVSLDSLWLKIKNIENITYRAAYLMGPYMLYCDVRTQGYHHSQKLFVSADQPQFEPNLQPHQEFIAELSLHNIHKRYVWIIDVVSQIVFTSNTQVAFEISVGPSKESIIGDSECDAQAGSFTPRLTVTRQNTLDLWNLPQQVSLYKEKKEHLVVLTHGLHSNVTADLFYLKEQIENSQKYYDNEQIVVKGFAKNVCKTEKGVKYLGAQLAEYIVKELYNDRVNKISFVGHSLGGLVQTFAIAYISVNYPWFFERVTPINFVTLASPLLGIVTDNPAYVKMFLSFGIVGKTGQDLGLEKPSSKERPLLYLLPGTPTKHILSRFKRRTVYANATNDGIVPLYTSALLFLDYDDILHQLNSNNDFQAKKEIESPDDFITRNFKSPLSKAVSLWAPQKFPGASISKIPKVSMFESAASVLIPPLPDKSYITDPSSRENIILHDKIYTDDDIPPRECESEHQLPYGSNSLLKPFSIARNGNYQKLEEEIARRWHEGLSWRKVVVRLKPGAHNNIIVRRRFANAYGWPVVDHLIQNHFNGEDDDADGEPLRSQNTRDSCESLEWITKPHKNSVFDVGPTGMISMFGEVIGSLAKGKSISQEDSKEKEPFSQQELFRYEDMDGSLY